MTPVTIAVVGSGPAGCYSAQSLRKVLPEAQITVIDRLPVPYGLVRYGVAADHQGTKGITAQFERMFQKSDIAFRGGVEVGQDVTLGELRSAFDIVVLATGLHHDRRLGVPGEDLKGVIPSGVLTRAFNSHPESGAAVAMIGQRVAVIGAGNIAADIVRLLSRSPSEWADSDMDPRVFGRIVPDPVREIRVLARCSGSTARWDPSMIRELGTLTRPTFHLESPSALDDPDSDVVKAVTELVGRGPGDGTLSVIFSFNSRVEELLGTERIGQVAILGQSGQKTLLEADTVVTAIGFETGEGGTEERTYRTGWLATGPRGTIPAQRRLAQELAARIVEDLESGAVIPGRIGYDAIPALASALDYQAWTRIDAHERERARDGRVRSKLADLATLEAVARGTEAQNKEVPLS